MNLDELEELARSSHSQSLVSIDSHELLELISVIRMAKDLYADGLPFEAIDTRKVDKLQQAISCLDGGG